MPIVVIAVCVILLDQLSKFAVQELMVLHESIPVIPGLMNITYILNKGAAFGILENQRWFFLVIAIVLVALFLFFGRRLPKHPQIQLGVGLLLGGAVGNGWDRFAQGAVTDFVDFHIWPVFNVADMGIVVGVGLLLWYSWNHSKE